MHPDTLLLISDPTPPEAMTETGYMSKRLTYSHFQDQLKHDLSTEWMMAQLYDMLSGNNPVVRETDSQMSCDIDENYIIDKLWYDRSNRALSASVYSLADSIAQIIQVDNAKYSLTFDAEHETIVLSNANGTQRTSIDAKEFLKDKFLQSADVIDTPSGKVLRFTFIMDDGSTKLIDIPIKDLNIDYTGKSKQIAIDTSHTISLDDNLFSLDQPTTKITTTSFPVKKDIDDRLYVNVPNPHTMGNYDCVVAKSLPSTLNSNTIYFIID